MMDFAPASPMRRGAENIAPMINVVFLLLIFFLMSAQIAPPDPFEVAPPTSTADAPRRDPGTLFINADGTLAFAGRTDDAALAALNGHSGPLSLRADARLPATRLAQLLGQLAARGITHVDLVTEAR